jgi:hypothetical protein
MSGFFLELFRAFRTRYFMGFGAAGPRRNP